ncbi:MAG: indole-3-glycerol-phosphate synthase [actinobacterium acIB-AMD-6]|jgi:indole-3-glycerol phosphate synthase|nr:MAG: indole-3-glycerol-phosphate synthase [actinobacterium acIB-AMD-6]
MNQKLKALGIYFLRERIQLMESNSALSEIIEGVLEDVNNRLVPISILEKQLDQAPVLRDAYSALSKKGLSLIAEVKRSSPSKGALATISNPVELANSYQAGGAEIISILTEERRFKGSISDLVSVRSAVSIPVLRKDFIVTEFQVYESRIIGSDLLLLIVAGLSKSQLKDYFQLATGLGMQVLVEVHDLSEVELALEIDSKIIGVNCRNLKTLEIDKTAFDLILPRLPENVLKVAESGISTRDEVEKIESLGADAILVGETLVKSGNPVHTIKELLNR